MYGDWSEEEIEQLKEENKQLKLLLGRVHRATMAYFKPKTVRHDDCPYHEILALYHRIMPNLAQVRKLTTKRKTTMRLRWVDDLPTLADWQIYFQDVKTKPFLAGKNERNWKAGFDFLIREDTVIKMQEGKYNVR